MPSVWSVNTENVLSISAPLHKTFVKPLCSFLYLLSLGSTVINHDISFHSFADCQIYYEAKYR